MNRLNSFWTIIDGLHVHSRVCLAGEPPNIVLVHGLGVSSRYLVPTALSLAGTHPLSVPDLPGFGRSSRPKAALDIPQLADSLAKWMRTTCVQPAVLVGNSMGCQIIVDLALRYPQLALGLVLLGPTMDSSARTPLRQFARLLRDSVREPIRLNLLVAFDYLNAGVFRTVRTFQHALRDPIESKVSQLSLPVLVVRGSEDPIAPRRWTEELARRAPFGSHVVIQEAAHVTNFTAPDEVATLVRTLIASLDIARAA